MIGLKVGDVGDSAIDIRRRIYRRIDDSTKSKREERIVPLTDEGTERMLREYLTILADTSPTAGYFRAKP